MLVTYKRPRKRSLTMLDPNSFGSSIVAWWDFTDSSLITKSYINFAFTVSGTSGTKTLTASTGISALLLAGMKLLINGSDIYTVANAGGTSITTVENLTTNYTAATSATERCSQFLDKSSYARNLSQSTSSIRPIYISNSIGNLPGIAFCNNAYFDFSSITLSTSFCMFFVLRSTTFNTTRMIIGSGSSGNNNKIGMDSSGNFFVRIINSGSTDQSISFPAPNSVLFVRRDDSNKIDTSFNYSSLNRLFSDIAQSGNSVYSVLGIDDATSSSDWSGFLSEVMIINRDISNTELSFIYRYLNNKYSV